MLDAATYSNSGFKIAAMSLSQCVPKVKKFNPKGPTSNAFYLKRCLEKGFGILQGNVKT